MCLLAICEKKPIEKEHFEKAFFTNDDGFGFAYRRDGKVHYFKGLMKVKEAWEFYNSWVKESVSYPHVIHFRLGKPTLPELTHPFEISSLSPLSLYNDTKGQLLFHNGVVSGWKDRMFEAFALSKKIPEGPMIDTRTIAILYHHYGQDIFRFIEGKWVVFSPTELKVFGEFTEDDGIQYSNSTYKPYTYTKKNNQQSFNVYGSHNPMLAESKDVNLFDLSDYITEFIV